MKFPYIQRSLKKRGYKLGSHYLIKASQYFIDVPHFIKKMERYIQEYTEEGKSEFVLTLKEILKAIDGNDWVSAFKLLQDNRDLRVDLQQTGLFLQNKANDQKLEQKGLSHWGETPGEYIAYRAGSIAKAPRGIFFAAFYEDAEQYAKIGDEYRPVHKYLLKLGHPLVAQKQNDAIEKLGEKPIMHRLQRDLDTRLVRLLKKHGYDSALLLRPALPAIREIVIVDPSSIVEQLD